MVDQRLKIDISARDRTRQAFGSLRASVDRVKSSVLSAKGALVGFTALLAGSQFIRSLVGVNREYQSLQATLLTFTGSAERAAEAFRSLKQFASETPFALSEVTQAYNRMLAVGLNPSIEGLRAFGNVASGSGKTVLQFVEAVADAAVGEFERLKEFGIKASKQGEIVKFTFRGIQTSVKNTDRSIQNFLENLGRTEFAGAMERQAATLNGAFSNLGDAVDGFLFKIGETGLNKALTDSARSMSDFITKSDDLAAAIGRLLTAIVRLPGKISEAHTRLIRLFDEKAEGISFFDALSRGAGVLAEKLGLVDKNVKAVTESVNRVVKGDLAKVLGAGKPTGGGGGAPSLSGDPTQFPAGDPLQQVIDVSKENSLGPLILDMQTLGRESEITGRKIRQSVQGAFDQLRLTGNDTIDGLLSKLLELAAVDILGGQKSGDSFLSSLSGNLRTR